MEYSSGLKLFPHLSHPSFSGVGGGAASGKSTVCEMIIEQLHDQRVVLVNQVVQICHLACYFNVFQFVSI